MRSNAATAEGMWVMRIFVAFLYRILSLQLDAGEQRNVALIYLWWRFGASMLSLFRFLFLSGVGRVLGCGVGTSYCSFAFSCCTWSVCIGQAYACLTHFA